MAETVESLAESQWRQRLAAFADALIPGGAGMPSACAAGVHEAGIDRALACRPDLRELVSGVIGVDAEPREALKRLRAEQPGVFDRFAVTIAGIYFMNPDVRRLVGYPGDAPQRKRARPGEAEAYLKDGILDPVIERGPIYRPTPTR